MEVVITSPNSHFDFRRPHATAPSSPKRLGEYYLSAPTSPSRLSQFYRDLDDLFADGSGGGGSAAAVPFEWEEKPGTPKSPPAKGGGDDFAFDVSEDWETASLPADELFDGGMIKPLKPPPRLQFSAAARVSEDPAASPRRRRSTRKTYDPFAVAAKKAAGAAAPLERGRERGVIVSKSSSRRAARSLSPLRDGQYQWEEVKEHSQNAKHGSAATPSAVTSALSTAVKGSKKWRLKDFFLFRSASEGRADERDPLKKYTAAWRRSSFQYVEGPGSGSGSKRRGPVSAHELHYTMNRAVSEDLKKKTFLPYRQGILGRLAFNPAVHALANGFGFSRKS